MIFGIFLSHLILSLQNEEASVFPKFISDQFTFTAWVNQGEDYLKEHYRWITRLIASYVKAGYFMFEDFLIDLQHVSLNLAFLPSPIVF